MKILPLAQAAAEAHYDLTCPLYKPGDRIVYTVNGGGERTGTIVLVDGGTISTMDDGIKMTVSVQKRDIKRFGGPLQ